MVRWFTFAALGLAIFLFIPHAAHAAPTVHWSTDDVSVTIEDGGTYAVPIGVSGSVSIQTDEPAFGLEGVLFSIPDPSEPTRVFEATFTGGPILPGFLTWPHEGVYEIDLYETPPPTPSLNIGERIFAWLVGRTAHAQDPEFFIGTIRFTIEDGSAPQYEECCSSVIFLPGLKGSVLKAGSDIVWPPDAFNLLDFSNDIQQLAVDPATGESVNSITVEGILESFHTTAIYNGFTSFMDGLVSSGTIAAWEAFPYDWRFSPGKVVADQDMVARLEQLAQDSQTGQVTVIAHSMGGLVGKHLIKELEAEGKEGVIDSFVMVGVPQLGTPQAIASLLHGDGEGILGGLIVNAADVRAVSQNMESGYNLLPSPQYFDEVNDPVIAFNENADFTQAWRDFWGPAIDTYLDFFSFVTGGGVPRTNPSTVQLHIPEILRPELVTDANDLHAGLDAYEFPEEIRVVQVAGWGLPTTKAIEYKNKHFSQNYQTVLTIEGDSTVVSSSAISSEREIYFFNLLEFNRNPSVTARHRDLLSANPVQSTLNSIVQEQEVEGINFLSEIKPTVDNTEDQLVLRTNSPVVLGAHDSSGNFTGINPNQDLDSAILFVTEDIPGSSFLISGDSQTVFLPQTGQYRFEYKGTGDGPTTVELGSFSNDQETIVQTYSEVPTSNQTSAEIIVDSANPENAVIEIDSDGDGDVDSVISPDSEELTLDELFVLLKKKIKGLNIRYFSKRVLAWRIDLFERQMERIDNPWALRWILHAWGNVVKRVRSERVNENDKEEILDILEQIKNKI